LFYKY
jgi:hypothetical protein